MGELPRVPPSLAPPADLLAPAVPPASLNTHPEIVSAQDLIDPADYGQILIFSWAGEEEDEEGYGHVLGALDDARESNRFVGVRPGFIELLTPGQWNMETPMRLEIWSSEPADDRGDWDHEVDADFDVPDGQIHFAAPAGSGTRAEVPAGR